MKALCQMMSAPKEEQTEILITRKTEPVFDGRRFEPVEKILLRLETVASVAKAA